MCSNNENHVLEQSFYKAYGHYPSLEELNVFKAYINCISTIDAQEYKRKKISYDEMMKRANQRSTCRRCVIKHIWDGIDHIKSPNIE